MTARKIIFILVAKGVQDEEFLYPYYRVQESHKLLVFGGGVLCEDHKGKYVPGKYGVPCRVDHPTEMLYSLGSHADGVIIPGGLESPEILRQDHDVLNFVEDCNKKGLPIGAICHGPQVLISAKVLGGKYATCFWGMKDDLINAGAKYVEDQGVVTDLNIITSPHYKHNPEFVKAVLDRVV